MGKVTGQIKIRNYKHNLKAEEKIIDEKEIRKLTIENRLVDSGATTLCLPKN